MKPEEDSSASLKRAHSPTDQTLGDSAPPPKRQASEQETTFVSPKSVPPAPCDAGTADAPLPRPASANPNISDPTEVVQKKPEESAEQQQQQTPTEAATEPAKPEPPAPTAPPPTPKPALPSIDNEVRIAFTGLDIEVRLACVQLLNRMVGKPEVAPFRFVETVQEATHVVADRLLRTPKIYMAVALGRALVTPKWIQACVQRGNWLGKSST